MGNITPHDSFWFHTIFHDVNTNLKLWSLICNYNQSIITFIKYVVSKVLAAYIISVLKRSIKHSIIIFFSSNNFGWNKTSHIGIKYAYIFHLDSHPKGTWGLLFLLYSSTNEIEGVPNRSNADSIYIDIY